MKLKLVTLLLILFSPLFALADNETPLTDEEKYIEWAKGIWDSIDRQTGDIVLPDAGAKLHVPEDFYYLSPKDSERILVEVWGNPPGQDTLGMLFPAESTPFDQDSWAVTISYEEDGYVSDEDADKIDYSELLEEMQSSSSAQNEERVKQGYDPVVLVGWAAQPYYDKESHKLHWAKELKFGNQETNTLNYNIRVLGRKGVLVLNFIADMDQKELIETKLDTVLSLADFDQGSTYKDFDPQIDKVAAYGIGALVAGKVLAKTGFFAIGLIFIKKFGVFIVVGLGALFKGLFKRKDA
ncbi:DUF2167 domain-containing protein [Desulfosediminicola flagellatus]|uniref:DUF2167 domain-containing protein n=1 Tax=Desulfosediminicola flagellatus TaxID=2569541 RepID=UPI0010AD8C08|nr:DUF2167 domain-containing protein [Desulfosediminicola flagellatus]